MAELMSIKIYPCGILRQKSKKVAVADLKKIEIQQLILNMGKMMREKDGIGLAAPQVGKNLKVIVINTKDGDLALINPRILRKSWEKELGEEGCLSLPEIFGLVKRSVRIRVAAFNKDGKKVRFKAEGFFARVIQHEVDHLRGVLFIDKAKEIIKGQDKLENMKHVA